MNKQKPPQVPCKILLMDTDVFVYRYALMNHEGAASAPMDTNDGPLDPLLGLTEDDRLGLAKVAFRQKLEHLKADTGVDTIRLALAPKGIKCFRYEFFKDYKGHRPEPPPIISRFREWIRETYQQQLLPQIPGAETDDILGHFHRSDGYTCIVSNDKDFHTLPGWNYHPFTGDLHWITPAMAKATYWHQVLMGDSADGFKGAKGIGRVKATNIILEALEAGDNLGVVVLETFLEKGQCSREFLVNALCADVSGRMRKMPQAYKEAPNDPN